MVATTKERFEVIIHTESEGAHSAEMFVKSLKHGRKFLDRLGKVLGNREAMITSEFSEWADSGITTAWIAGEETGSIYLEM